MLKVRQVLDDGRLKIITLVNSLAMAVLFPYRLYSEKCTYLFCKKYYLSS